MDKPLKSGRSKKYRPDHIRERNQDKIMAAAEFTQHGFRGETIQSIAEWAGLPKSNIFY